MKDAGSGPGMTVLRKINNYDRRQRNNCYPFNFSTKDTYNCIASSLVFPFRSDHAWYLALLTKSNGLEGASVFTSPSVLCLKREYNFSNVSLSGFEGSSLLSLVAFSNSSFNSMNEIYTKIC